MSKRKLEWSFVAYGTSVDLENNGFAGSVEENTLSVWSLNGKGKIVPASTDGLAFYYTVLDAETENFTLSADLEVESWTFSNGQDGFGLMAADSIGENGSEVSFWNNSYMASVTRVDYAYDPERKCPGNTGEQYFMKLGVGAQEKKGITPGANESGTQIQKFSSTMHTLETTAPERGLPPGTYNLVGRYTNAPEKMQNVAELTTFHLSLRRLNGGYMISYTNQEGVTTCQKFYNDENGDALMQLAEKRIYVGFFASRNAKVKVRNVELTTIPPAEDDEIGERPFTLVTPEYAICSATVANREDYELVYYGNANGNLSVRDEFGVEIASKRVQASTKCRVNTSVHRGENTFYVTFLPDADYQPSPYEKLSDHEKREFVFTVTYEINEGELLYIGPGGTAQSAGTRQDPIDIYTAVRGAVPGQRLVLLPGRYCLEKTVCVERGMDGTKEQPIVLEAEEGSRPVLDFCRKCEAMILAGDYWRVKGFDVTNSGIAERGVVLAGSHNILERISVYRNGNTGLQIGCYSRWDSREDWPADNLVLNCTSYLNADPGYTDCDGFAAKITVADGNVFDGCISAYNADDGFDLFAKVEKGATGSVLIRNCLAFKNGYVLDDEGKEVHAGLGNGFKLGGSSIACGHRLEHSIAFANGEKGVDSNSCPDDHISHVISFNNDSHNVALFTTDAKNTAFTAEGVLSFRTEAGMPDQLDLKGMQDKEAVYGESNYYQGDGISVNTKGRCVEADWFEKLDVEEAIHGGICRDENGHILLNGFLVLTDKAPADTGTRW
ncbi:MAG: right-handed parallel beta-helix repeat-containing protein [Acetatifactor sp.]|nr:right-handed parallel beta-helix repeat-containing protein [Acetatifactor sp.]